MLKIFKPLKNLKLSDWKIKNNLIRNSKWKCPLNFLCRVILNSEYLTNYDLNIFSKTLNISEDLVSKLSDISPLIILGKIKAKILRPTPNKTCSIKSVNPFFLFA